MAKLSLILLAAPLALAGFSVPALAQDQESVVVRYDDLNLASAKGRERLTTRVRVAVRQVCRTQMNPSLRERIAARECEQVATRDSDIKLASLFSGNGTALADRGQMVVAAP